MVQRHRSGRKDQQKSDLLGAPYRNTKLSLCVRPQIREYPVFKNASGRLRRESMENFWQQAQNGQGCHHDSAPAESQLHDSLSSLVSTRSSRCCKSALVATSEESCTLRTTADIALAFGSSKPAFSRSSNICSVSNAGNPINFSLPRILSRQRLTSF